MGHARGFWYGLGLGAVLSHLLAGAAWAAWATDPAVNTAICTITGEQLYAEAVTDGAGGAIITWQDARLGISNYDIHAQRVDAAGTVLWADDGVVVCNAAGNQQVPQLVSDGAGGAIIVWLDNRAGGIYAQHVDAWGNALWTANGVALCSVGGSKTTLSVKADGMGGAICTWVDDRGGFGYTDIYAQRVSGGGTVQWGAGAVAVCTASFIQSFPAITGDGAGGAIITWQDCRDQIHLYHIYAQRIASDGSPMWAANGVVVCNATVAQQWPKIDTDGAGGAIITWQDKRTTAEWDIYAQRVSNLGVPVWTANGVPVCNYSGDQAQPLCVSDGTGGLYVTWIDPRLSLQGDMYVQRIDGAGVRQWNADGVGITATNTTKLNHDITGDGNGGALIAWQDLRGTSYDIYVQKVGLAGTAAWTGNGVAVGTAVQTQRFPTVVRDGAGGAILAFEDRRTGTDYDIYAQKVGADGSLGAAATGVGNTSPPAAARLHQNYPNPFNPVTTISFDLRARSLVTLAVYDMRGHEVAVLAQGELGAGAHERVWNAEGLASGVYVYRLTALPSATVVGAGAGPSRAIDETRKLILLK